MRDENGFTLIELLLALSIWSIFILLLVPFGFKQLEAHEEQQLLKILKSDILYAQYLSTISEHEKIYITFNKNNYTMRNDVTKKALNRDFPTEWEVEQRV